MDTRKIAEKKSFTATRWKWGKKTKKFYFLPFFLHPKRVMKMRQHRCEKKEVEMEKIEVKELGIAIN